MILSFEKSSFLLKKVFQNISLIVFVLNIIWMLWAWLRVWVSVWPCSPFYFQSEFLCFQEKFRREFAVRLPCLKCLKDTQSNRGRTDNHPAQSSLPMRSYNTLNGRNGLQVQNKSADRNALLSPSSRCMEREPGSSSSSMRRNSHGPRETIKIEVHRPENKVVKSIFCSNFLALLWCL